MNEFNPGQFVHKTSAGRWIVASCHSGQYRAPLNDAGYKATGCSAYFGSTPDSVTGGYAYTYKRRSDALRRARQQFGGTDYA